MKKRIPFIFFIIGTVAIAGCASSGPSVALGSHDAKYEEGQPTYAISAFQDANAATDKMAYPDASEVVRSDVEFAFIALGKHVVHDDNGDIEVVGIVTSYYRGAYWGRYSTVGLDLTATDKKSGRVIWKASVIKSTKFHYDYDPAKLAREVTGELVKAVFASPNKR
jgi:hypothetical protein